MTPEEQAAFREIFSSRPDSPCADCGGFHLRTCPRIKRQVWIGNGNRVEVEYWPRSEWEDAEIIWPEDVFDDPEES